MPNTRIKICGITRPQDAALAAELGADAIGLNFVGGPRKLASAQAVEILKAIPPMVTPVSLLFIDRTVMANWEEALHLAETQLHFTFWNRVCQVYGFTDTLLAEMRQGMTPDTAERPDTWLPISIKDRASISLLADRLKRWGHRPGAILLDTASEKLGGTGQPFNWNWIAEARQAGELQGLPPIILAGGLTPDNVAEAIRIAKPYAVDVSSGVEIPAQPGIKDPIKMRDFIQAAKSAL